MSDEISSLFLQQEQWQLTYWGQDEKHLTLEFIPKEENLQDWTQMITLQFFPSSWLQANLLAIELMLYIKAKTFEICPQTHWDIHDHILDDVVYEWYVETGEKMKGQHEIVRLTNEENGISRLAFVKKGEPMDAGLRAKWLTWIRE